MMLKRTTSTKASMQLEEKTNLFDCCQTSSDPTPLPGTSTGSSVGGGTVRHVFVFFRPDQTRSDRLVGRNSASNVGPALRANKVWAMFCSTQLENIVFHTTKTVSFHSSSPEKVFIISTKVL